MLHYRSFSGNYCLANIHYWILFAKQILLPAVDWTKSKTSKSKSQSVVHSTTAKNTKLKHGSK
ncbi:hypothetical protein ACLUXD_08595 [Loigolactobacillus coryniformis subsp. coryniformis]|uniref:hypothetical protein n=1 Tax=Loigolactobacillus coryniformis TaxID=1610 RepID=UPI00177F9766|nr:hypothetical protein [Loigolactobacillus coryniformis]